jgi:hypothetical protein
MDLKTEMKILYVGEDGTETIDTNTKYGKILYRKTMN